MAGCALLVGLGWLGGAGQAWAHAAGLTSATSEPVVLGIVPAVPGLEVRAVEFGARLSLVNNTGERVAVQPLPGSVVSALPVVDPGGRTLWTDPRIVAAAAGDRPPEGRADWAIPLRVGASAVNVVGEQRWPPPPNAGMWWLLTGLAIALPAGLAALACRGRPVGWGPAARAVLAGSTVAVIAAHVLHVYGSSLVPVEGTFVWVFLGAAGFAVLAWPIGLAGAYTVLRGHSAGALLCLVAGALIAVIISPADMFSFHDAVVPYAWGADLDRFLIAVNVGGGLGVIAAATILMRRAAPTGAVSGE
ncbi:MAG: hypothetical protein ACT4O0_00130 [Pseudonocardia sp.]